jgi:hypothetical protein
MTFESETVRQKNVRQKRTTDLEEASGVVDADGIRSAVQHETGLVASLMPGCIREYDGSRIRDAATHTVLAVLLSSPIRNEYP